MHKFNEWFKKRELIEGFDAKSQSLGGNPLTSGLEKLSRGLRAGKLANGYSGGFSVIANHFNLSQPEVQILMKFKVITDFGSNINVDKLKFLQRQYNPGQSSRVDFQPSLMPPDAT